MNYKSEQWASFREKMLEHEILPEPEIKELIRKYRETGDVKYANKVAVHNLRLIFQAARTYAHPTDPKIWEYVNEGFEGLRYAMFDFDLTRDLKFISYAIWWARQRMHRYMNIAQSVILVPAEHQRRIKRAKLNALPADAVEHKRVAKYGLKAFRTSTVAEVYHLDAPDPHTNNTSTFMDSLRADEDSIPDAGRQLLPSLLSTLDDRELDIVSRYYGIGMAEPDTLAQLGSRYGLSKERVRQLKDKAMLKIQSKVKKRNLKFHELDLAAEFSS